MEDKNRAKKDFISIGKMAKLCDISVQTLRYYEEIGILIPAYKDEQTGYRYYSKENIGRLYLIKELRSLDMPIEYIRTLHKCGNVNSIVSRLQEKVGSYEEEIKRMELKKKEALSILAILKEGSQKSHQDQIVERVYDKRNVIATRKLSRCNEEGFLERCGELLQLVKQNHLHITGEMTAKLYGRMNEIDVLKADLEIALTVIEEKEACKEIKEEVEFKGICKRYIGPYEEIPMAYSDMLDYMKEKRYEIPPYFMCRYLISNVYSEDAKEYVTDIIIPIVE